MRIVHLLAGAALLFTMPAGAAPIGSELRPDQRQFTELFRELVETNTTFSSGSCTEAAEKMAVHLRAAGFSEKELTLFSAPEHPKEGGLVAVMPGSKASAKPILLLAHLDVVEAKREDWARDPFKLVEEKGYFFARGVSDDKAMAAIWVDSFIRLRKSGYRPKRTVKMALTCGEENLNALNGAQWLTENRPDLISAAFALNEGGGGQTDGQGHLVTQEMQVGEKVVQNFQLEATNPGGHSSVPVPKNAIYQLSRALLKVGAYEFPVRMSDTTRVYFERVGTIRGDDIGRSMIALAKNPNDTAAEAIVSQNATYHSMLRTTCVATLLSGGHAMNALPQRATALVNCRLFPGEAVEATQAALEAAIGDPEVKVTRMPPVRPFPVPPPLDPKVVGPAEALVRKHFPGVPLVPVMSTGGTDGLFLEAIGISTYGVPGLWRDPDRNNIHGLNERIEARSLYLGRDYLFDLVKAYADQ